MSLRPQIIWAVTSCPGQNRRGSWHDLRLLADQPWFKRLSHEDILMKIDTKSITGFHHKPHEWTLKAFQSCCLLSEYSRARHMWCAAAMTHSLEPNNGQDWCSNVGVIEDKGGPAPVNAIKALALNGRNTFFINAAVMLWKSNAIIRGTGGGSRGRGCHCIKWDACHFASLCWLVAIPNNSPYQLLKWRQKRSRAMSMPLGCEQWMLLSESGDVKSWYDLHVSRCQNLVNCCI